MRRNPSAALAALVVVVALLVLGTRGFSDDAPTDSIAGDCPGDPACAFQAGLADAAAISTVEGQEAPTLGPGVCREAGYLCAGLRERADPRVMRWADDTREIRVRILPPEFEDGTRRREYQSAAIRGVLAWQETPFPIRIVRSSRGEVDFEVRWVRTLGGSQLGQARTEWFRNDGRAGMRVFDLQLATRSPFDGNRALDPEQLRLTAAHEMGHALGLPHSDDPRDVMYPTNSAASITPQDYRSMNALYRLENGARIAFEGGG